MATIYVDNPVEHSFAMVPNALWDMPISLKAKGLFAFLLTFRDGSAPTVALIESALSIGKDARQAAFRELESVGLAGWSLKTDRANRIVGREMWISSRPLLQAAACARKPENPADGSRKPGKPAVGKPAQTSRKTRASEPENPAHKEQYKQEKRGPASARPVHRQPPRLPHESGGASVDPVKAAALVGAASGAVRQMIRKGETVLIGGQLVQPGSPDMLTLQAALRDLERGGSKLAPVSSEATGALVGSVASAWEKKGTGHAAAS